MGAKSYFYVYLRNFLLILSIPIITIFLLYVQAENIVEKQIVSENNNILNQFFRLIDEELYEMRNQVVTLGRDETCVTYAQYMLTAPDKTGYQGVLLKNALAEYVDEKYEDIFVYFPYDDRVVSGIHSNLNKERYWETYYRSCDFGDFEEELDCQSFQPVLCSIDGEEQSYLCVAMRSRNGRNPLRDFVVVVVMRPSYLERIMVVDERAVNGELIIYDRQFDILIGDILCEPDKLEIEGKENTSFVTSLEGAKYMVHTKSADNIAGGYAYLMPYAYFWRELVSLRSISWVGVAFCIVISFYLAYCRANKIYSPIKNMVEKAELLSDGSCYDEREINEFAFFEGIVQESNKKISVLQQQLVEWEDIQKQQFASNLLEGDIVNSNLEEEFLKKSISLSEDLFFIAVVSLCKGKEVSTEVQRRMLLNNIEEIHKTPIYVTPMTGERFAVILCLAQEETQADVLNTLEKAKQCVETRSGVLISIGLGGVYKGVQGMRRSYKEAEAALKYKWLLGEGYLIEYETISQRKMKYIYGSETKIFRMIMEFIKKDTGISASELTAKILELYDINSESSMDTIECFKFQIMSVVYNVILHIGASEHYRLQLQQLMELSTIFHYREQMTALFDELHLMYRENTNYEDICGRVVAYVQKYYGNPELSVAEISREVNLTSSYLTKQFKSRYNLSVLDYIAQVRITNAKALLVDSSLTVKQIAGMVGFMSDNVFIKTFKKWEAVTPKQYRDLRLEL